MVSVVASQLGTASARIGTMKRLPSGFSISSTSPAPTVSPCFYGVDTPRRSELIAATHSLEEIRRYIGADSLAYLSLDGLLASVGSRGASYCTSCYTGKYPVAFPNDQVSYLQLTLKPATGPTDALREASPESVG